MSEQQPLPPLPPQDPQVIAPTSPQVLPYAQAGEQRPGILTAVGIMSIVFGGLASLSNLCGVGQSIGYVFMSTMSATMMAAGPTTAPASPFANMPVTPFVFNALQQALSLALAVYLIVCGAFVLRDRVGGRRHHLRYTTLKFIVAVPVALVEGWSTYSMQSTMWANMPSSPATANPMLVVSIAAGTTGVWLALSLAYPVAIAIIMRLQQVRSYYAYLAEVGRY